MRNVIVTLDEETAAWARIEAARRDTSVSRLIGEMLRERMARNEAYEAAKKQFKTIRPVQLTGEGERYPSRDETHDRAGLR